MSSNDYRRGVVSILEDHSSIDDPSFFRLGILQLEVPPSDISVNKRSDYSVLQTVRAPADLLFKSGYAEYDIQIRLYFFYTKKDLAVNVLSSSQNDWETDSANNLRYIVGLYKTAPITIIYNRFIADQVYGIARLKTASMGQNITEGKGSGSDSVFMAVPVILDTLTIRVVPDFAGITYEVVVGAKYYNHSIISASIGLDEGLLSTRLARWNAEVVKRNIQHVKEFYGIDSSDADQLEPTDNGARALNKSPALSEVAKSSEDEILSFLEDENNLILFGSIYTMVGQPFASISDEIAHIERQLDRLEAEEEGDGDIPQSAEEKAAYQNQLAYYRQRREQLAQAASSSDGMEACDGAGGPGTGGPTAVDAAAQVQAGTAIGQGGVQNTGTTDYVSTNKGYIPITHRYPMPYPGYAGSGEWKVYVVDYNRTTKATALKGPVTMKSCKIYTTSEGQFFTAHRDEGARRHLGIDYNIACKIDYGGSRVENYEQELAWGEPGCIRAVVPIISPVAGGYLTARRTTNNVCGNMAIITIYDKNNKPQYEFKFCHLIAFYPGQKVGDLIPMGAIIGWVGNSGMRSAINNPLYGAHVHLQIKDLQNGGCSLNPDHFLSAGYLLFQGRSTELEAALRKNDPWEHCAETGGSPSSPSVPVTVGPVVSGVRGTREQTTANQQQLQQQLQMGDWAGERMQQLFMDGWLVDVHKSSRHNTVFYKTFTVPFIGADSPDAVAKLKGITSIGVNKLYDPKQSLMLINNIGAGFANKIVPIPIAGQSVPFYQHMGGSNINIVIEATALADESNGLCMPLLALQSLFAIKEQQILDLLGKMEFKPRDVFDVQTIYLHNLPLNNIGIFDVILSDISVSTTPGSPNVYQVRVSMVENFLYGFDLSNRSLAAGLMEEVIYPEMIADAILAMDPNYGCMGTKPPETPGKRKCFQLVENNTILQHTGELGYALHISDECKMNVPQGWFKFIAFEKQAGLWSEAIRYHTDYISEADFPGSAAKYTLSPSTFLLEFSCPIVGNIKFCTYYVYPILKAMDAKDSVWYKATVRAWNRAFGSGPPPENIDDWVNKFSQMFVYGPYADGSSTVASDVLYKQYVWEPGLRRFISDVVYPDLYDQLYHWKTQGRRVYIHQITEIKVVPSSEITTVDPSCQEDQELIYMQSMIKSYRAAKIGGSEALKAKLAQLAANRTKLRYRNGNIYLENNSAPVASQSTVLDYIGFVPNVLTGGVSGQIIDEFLKAYNQVVNGEMSEEEYRARLMDYYSKYKQKFLATDAELFSGNIPDKFNKDKGSTSPLAISAADLTPTCYADLLLKAGEDPANYLTSETNLDYLGSAVNLLDATTVNTAALEYSFVDEAFKHGVFVEHENSASRAGAVAPAIGAGVGFSYGDANVPLTQVAASNEEPTPLG